jgi:diguanylate cyclase (GGDEF)-like protein
MLPEIPGFIAAYQAALAILDLVTAVLLFGQYAITRLAALLVLASGYLFTATMAVSHALTFPGLFATNGLLGASGQTTAWLYMLWHGGFPIAVVAYAFLKRSPSAAGISGGTVTKHIVLAVLAVLAAVTLLTFIATAGASFLPSIMQGNGYSPTLLYVVSLVWSLSLVALVALTWWCRPHSVLDLWLMVVICAWLFDVALSAVLNGGRYDVGFYIGRIEGLVAASIVLMMLMQEIMALYGQLIVANRTLEDLANRDGLTGIHNRRRFDERLRSELSRCQRSRQPLSLLLIDVDLFKQFNDIYGHLDGDACLREIATAISRAVMRPGDLAARFGGEEFAVILPETDAIGASRVAELIRRAIVDASIPHSASEPGVVTVSIGQATHWPHRMSTIADVIAAADQALYAAKAGGRNRVSAVRGVSLELPPSGPNPGMTA